MLDKYTVYAGQEGDFDAKTAKKLGTAEFCYEKTSDEKILGILDEFADADTIEIQGNSTESMLFIGHIETGEVVLVLDRGF